MKMKKITLGFSLLIAAGLFVVSCNKKTNTEPEQDMEFNSSRDAAYANSVVADLDIIVSYLGENLLSSSFFQVAPGSAGSITTNRDTVNKILSVTYSGSVTCRDGKKRNGSITVDYSGSNNTYGAKFYRDAGFKAVVNLNGYWVDGIFVDDITAPFVIRNNVAFGYNPANTNLSWDIDGYFLLKEETFATDSSKNIIWKGKLTKTLKNTNVASVFNSSKLNPINWVSFSATGTPTSGAMCAYTGTVTGVTSRVVSYTFVSPDDKPLTIDFACAPDKILGVTTTPSVLPVYSQWHPFIGGVASFTTLGAGTTYPRVIDFGNEGANPCDNSGIVTIKGISYNIDFRKK